MKNLLFLFMLCANGILAQDSDAKYGEHVESMDNILNTLYNVISGNAGEERDWELFRYLFKEDARLIPSGPTKEGVFNVRYLSPEDYISSSGNWLVENGFFEKEICRVVENFGAITHVFSSYESFRSSRDKEPFMRGINSIQLLNDGSRWWIVNIYWFQENKAYPIPDKYLIK